MSHFSLLVIGDNVEEQLAPFHEFESTGDDNEFVQDVDQTSEALADYHKLTETRYKDPNGVLHDPYTPEGDNNPIFWREPTHEEKAKYGRMIGSGYREDIHYSSQDWGDGFGYRPKIFYLPEGWTEIEVPKTEIQTFAEFCADYYGYEIVPFGEEPDFSAVHKFGYTLVDAIGAVIKTVDRTNLNKQWDWYQIGGRWHGFFKLHNGTIGLSGEPGIQVMNEDYEPPARDRADQCLKGDIDIEGMRQEAVERAAKQYYLFLKVAAGTPTHKSWKQLQVEHQTGEFEENGEPKVNWKAAREAYGSQPAVKALRQNDATFWFDADNFLCSREEYIERARQSALSTFAVIQDGKWYSKGKMGWWGIVRDAKDQDTWNVQVSLLIDSLPDNTLLTVVDCHI